jgi:hypothetical protein
MSDSTKPPRLERAFKWFLSFLPAGEWALRKAAIERDLEAIFASTKPRAEGIDYYRLIGPEDQIGWYLYLVETSLYDPRSCEVNQASRILPVFRRLGMDVDVLPTIGGLNEKVLDVLNHSKAQPASVLFEMLIALVWKRNGWNDVAFIPADPTEKRPDIRAANGADEWFVETKRLTTQSAYSLKERGKWSKMWSRLKGAMVAAGAPLLLDITFHVEPHSFGPGAADLSGEPDSANRCLPVGGDDLLVAHRQPSVPGRERGGHVDDEVQWPSDEGSEDSARLISRPGRCPSEGHGHEAAGQVRFGGRVRRRLRDGDGPRKRRQAVVAIVEVMTRALRTQIA